MNTKSIIQVLMILLIILISWLFFFKYFKKKTQNLTKGTINEKMINNENASSNYIDNINYISTDTKGNKYQITAEEAEIEISNPDVMFLKNIVSYVFIKDSDKVKITSDYGKYNSKNYDTIFSKNVIIVYPGHKITSEYLDFSFLENLGTISTNVIYTNDDTKLIADRIEMNIATKDTKIFMYDEVKKVLIEGTR